MKNREIKFRAWFINEMYHYVEVTTFEDGSSAVTMLCNEKAADFMPCFSADMDKINLMQFTGLKDKNWKEIYEGDIVLFGDKDERGYIIYSEPFSGFKIQDSIIKRIHYHIADYDNIEIIGNIYENPELL